MGITRAFGCLPALPADAGCGTVPAFFLVDTAGLF